MTAPRDPEETAGVRPAASPQPAPGAGRPEAADGAWHRVHPISPWVRGWVVLVAMLFVATQSFGEDLVRTLVGQGEFQAAEGLWITLAIYGAVFVVMVIIYYFSWRFTKYQLAEEQVLLDTGVIFRQHRRVRYDRVQAVDIRQPLLARTFGLAELKFEAADGGSTAMQLAFIKEDEARILRAEIMGRAAGIRAGADPEEVAQRGAAAAAEPAGQGEGEDHGDHRGDGPRPGPGEGQRPATVPQHSLPEAPEHIMLKVPVGRMIGSVLLSTAMIVMISIVVVLVLGAWILDLTVPQDGEDSWWLILLFVLLPFVFSLVGVAWGGFNKGYNFTVATSPDGLRLRYGLLETSQQTVPPGRVQAVRISQGLLWRAFGWYRMSVNVAGYGAVTEGSGADKSTVLPVGTIEDVLRVLSVVAPDPGVEDAPEVIRAGITGSGDGQGFTPSPRRVRWLDPLTWKRNAYRSTDTMVLLRSGRLERHLVLMPHERIQSIGLHQGPLERRLRVATLRFHSTAGPVVPMLPHAEVDVAVRLFHEEADIAAVSRRMRDRNQWMRQEELARFEQRTQQVIEQ
ncbi:PH domain-containing protein [Citricoccus sp. NPDC079358]|uniref:PH domain-containing protein n=1 Tax=Citricoccus sp. NPDC079358 TaxID=3154653 RepID=UPI00344FE645